MSEKKAADPLEAELSRLKSEFEALKRTLSKTVERETEEGVERVRTLLAPELERAGDMVRSYPVLSLLLAGAFGFLLGRLGR
jgi:ElaB/YqjD/DUF883 family membrane-anchored ribosome-binding protein